MDKVLKKAQLDCRAHRLALWCRKTNILISALGWKGNPRFKFTEEQKDRFLSILLEVATLVKIKSEVDVIKEDPSDNVILEPANEIKIDYIVSGNDHLLNVKEFKGAKIITAIQFLDL